MNPLIPRALELRASGLTIAAIAQQLGRSKYTVSLYLDPDRMARHVARSRTASAAAYARDPVSRRAAAKEYATRNPEARKVRNQRYSQKNRWRVVLSRLEYRRLRSKDARFVEYYQWQERLLLCLFQKVPKWNAENLFCCTQDDLRNWLTAQADGTLRLDAFPDQWEIGFKTPPADFSHDNLLTAFHYTNLIVITPAQRREQDRAEERFWKAPASKYVD